MITESFNSENKSRMNPASMLGLLFTFRKAKHPALRKFSTMLMTTIISLVTLSVVILLYVLNSSFNNRVEEEFRKKLQAEKGQIELLIKNRLNEVNNLLKELSNDNTIRATMMFDDQSRLSERIRQKYKPVSGAYQFIQREKSGLITPQTYKSLSKETVLSAFSIRPHGEVLMEKDRPRLMWLFTKSIVGTEGDLGTAAVLYDIMGDTKLVESIMKAGVKGDLIFKYEDQLVPLGNNLARTQAPGLMNGTDDSAQTLMLIQDKAYSRIMGNRNLYYVSSAQDFLSERKKVTLLMWIFSAFVLAVSVLISAFLAGKMIRPLKDMTRKAIQISEGKDIPLNFERNSEYWEFNQLTDAFNTMFVHIKEAEERSRYQELLENVDDAVYIIDVQGSILEANSATYETLGYSREHFINQQLKNIVPPDAHTRIVNLGKTDQDCSESEKLIIETVHLGKDGQSIPVEIHSRRINYMGKSVILNVARDITERIEAEKLKKDLENQLNHAQKMEAMGTMAGCIAHDFNNLLAGIQGNAEILSLGLKKDHPLYSRVETINKALDSATSLTRKLLGFARREESKLTPIDINALVEETTGMFIKSRKEIKLELKFENGTWPVSGNPGELEQVLINLYINAWQAMPEGGGLNIKTENVQLTQTFCRPFDLSGGDYVHISVSDTGIGMVREIMNKIFDPFFTTKEKGKGTGLGLASAYGIIRNHKGIITVESAIGKGTTFNIYLPSASSGAKM
jgi:PAS domain S-box-containing protein